MSDETIQVGEKLYEVAVQFTDVTEFGVSLEALLAGETPPPPEGARIDVYFEGTISGERINGAVKAIARASYERGDELPIFVSRPFFDGLWLYGRFFGTLDEIRARFPALDLRPAWEDPPPQ